MDPQDKEVHTLKWSESKLAVEKQGMPQGLP